MEIYGVRLIGVNTHTGEKLIFTLVLIAFFVLLRFLLKALTRLIFSRYQETRIRFWSRQGIDVGTTILFVVGLISIWFDNPANLATGVGLGSAGLAFALQKVITSLAGYLVILRGKTVLSRPPSWRWDSLPRYKARSLQYGSPVDNSPDAS
jgi:small-conductance mechanosensitive channel